MHTNPSFRCQSLYPSVFSPRPFSLPFMHHFHSSFVYDILNRRRQSSLSGLGAHIRYELVVILNRISLWLPLSRYCRASLTSNLNLLAPNSSSRYSYKFHSSILVVRIGSSCGRNLRRHCFSRLGTSLLKGYRQPVMMVSGNREIVIDEMGPG